jgi:DNA-binding protein Fis/HAMP domain-containing protein
MKLVRRLTIHLLLVFGLVFAADAYLGIRDQLEFFGDDIRRDHIVIGQGLRGAVEEEWREAGDAGVGALLDRADAHTEGVRMQLVQLDAAADGALLPPAAARSVWDRPRAGAPLHLRDDGDAIPRLVTYVPLQIPGRPGAALEIAQYFGPERLYAMSHLRRTLATAAAVFAACGLVAWVVGVRVVGRPIADLVAKAHRIGEGDFSAPLDFSRDDELALLAREMNATAELPCDARVVAATNRDLETAVEQGRFREDLYFRLDVLRIEVPPLRSRGNDVLVLAQHFLRVGAARSAKELVGLSRGAAEMLLGYAWPGNVRELQSAIERAIALARHDQILVEDLAERIRSYRRAHLLVVGDDPSELVPLDVVEGRYIARVLEAVAGNKTLAARILGLDRKTLYRKLDRIASRRP